MVSNKQANEKLDLAYKEYYNDLLRFCNSRLKNQHQADDCVQECFLVLYKRFLKNDEIHNVKLYLYKIADNVIKSQWRKNKKNDEIVDIDALAEVLTVNSTQFESLDFENLDEKFSSALNENEYLVYKLKYIEDKSIKQISEETGLSFETVAKRLSRIRNKLKEIFLTQQ